jgi:BirA family biotin operon repressor/biotin-[acetyl-CoA-carboxylase] ligase
MLDVLTDEPERVSLKWPNDALLDGQKVAGVLLESGVGPAGRWLSVGVGVNLAHAPEETRWPATSIAVTTGKPAPTAQSALTILATAFDTRDRDLATDGFDTIRTAWLARAARLGQIVEARLPRETVTGRFETLDADGAMLLQTDTGARRISAADVYFPSGHFPGGADAAGH